MSKENVDRSTFIGYYDFPPYLGTILLSNFWKHCRYQADCCCRKKKLKKQPYKINLSSPVPIDEGLLSESDLQVVRFNTVYNTSALTCCNKADFFKRKSHYSQLFYDIEHAKKCIFIKFTQSITIWSANTLSSCLEKKPRKGWRYG